VGGDHVSERLLSVKIDQGSKRGLRSGTNRKGIKTLLGRKGSQANSGTGAGKRWRERKGK